MRFYIIILLAVLIQFNNLEAKKYLNILNSDIQKFPENSTEFYYFNNNFVPYDFLDKDNFKIHDNNVQTNLLNIEKYQQFPVSAVSVVIAFDLAVNSESGKVSDLHLGKYIANLIANQLQRRTFEIALTSFDTGNYLNYEFSDDSATYALAIDNLLPTVNSNYDAGFIKRPSGAISVALESKYKKSIILITDRKNVNNYHYVIEQMLNDNNISLYCFTIGYETQKEFKQVSESTGGIYFESISDSSEVENAVFTCLADMYEFKPSKVLWEAHQDCNIEHEVYFELIDSNVIDKTTLEYPTESMPLIEIEPEFLAFSAVLAGDTKDMDVVLTAKKGDILINDLSFKLPVFTIVKGGLSTTEPTLIIRENEQHTLTIRFTPLDSTLVFDSLNIGSNACSSKKLLITGGFPNTPPKERNLTIISPGCPETLIIGDTATVEWTGLLPNDVIQLEYTLDGGKKWDVLGKNVNGLKYNWVVPDVITDKCKIRALQLWPNNVGQTMDFHHDNLVQTANFNELGDMIVSTSDDSTARVWNSNNGFEIHRLIGHKAKVNWACFSPDGKQVVTASDDSTIKVWDVSNSQIKNPEALFTLSDHKAEVKSANYSPDGIYIITAGWDGSVKQWDSKNGNFVRNITKETYKLMYSEYSKDGKYVLSCGNSKDIKIWNTETWKLVKKLSFFNGSVLNANFSFDNKRVVSSGWLGLAVVWDFEKGDTLYTIMHSHDTTQGVNAINSAVFDKSGKYFLTTSVDKTAKMWETQTGNLVKSLKEHRSNVGYATFNFDGSRILTSSWDSTAKIWNLDKRDLQTDSTQCNISLDMPSVSVVDINLGDVVIGSSKYCLIDTFLINNKGFPIKVKDIVIKDDDSSSFSIVSGEAPYKLDSMGTSNIEVLFIPKTQGLFSAKIEILVSGMKLIGNIKGYGYEPELKAMVEEIDFGQVEIGDFKDTIQTSLIKNISGKVVNVTEIYLAGPDNVHFILKNLESKMSLLPNETLTIELRYLANELRLNSSKIIISYDGLGKQSVISLFAEGIKPRIDTAIIAIDNIESEQNRIIEIPIKLKFISEKGFRASIEGFTLDLTFNGTMLEPLFEFTNSSIEGKLRTLSLTIPATYNSDMVMYKAKFRVALGNDTITKLMLSNLQLIGKGKTQIELEDGEFKLMGFCTKGGTRLFDADGKMILFQNRPNPFETTTTIEFEVFEPGRTQLYVMDMLGKIVKNIVDFPLSKGTHAYQIDVPELPTGSYYYVLQTPTYRMSKRMEVKR